MAVNDDSQDLHISLEEIKELSAQPDTKVLGSGLWRKCHRLADAKYPPAKDFFVEKLDDKRWDWRRVSVSLLGFHYDELEPEIVEKIRDLLINDSDSGVRIAAAYVLGHRSKLPEKTLIHALVFDLDKDVKISAFNALLSLAGVPYRSEVKVMERIRRGEIIPGLDQLKHILEDENLYSSINLVDEK